MVKFPQKVEKGGGGLWHSLPKMSLRTSAGVCVCESYSLSNIVRHQIFSVMDYKYKVSVCCCQDTTKKLHCLMIHSCTLILDLRWPRVHLTSAGKRAVSDYDSNHWRMKANMKDNPLSLHFTVSSSSSANLMRLYKGILEHMTACNANLVTHFKPAIWGSSGLWLWVTFTLTIYSICFQ